MSKTWTLADSLVSLREQVNARTVARSKKSDGSIGDVAHSSRTSDHNPNSRKRVNAIDITHDPASGADMARLAEALVKSRDSRISYIIFKGRILSSTVSPWKWRPYSGSNKHNQHMHISVNSKGENDDWDFNIEGFGSPLKLGARVLSKGRRGEDVEDLQRLLGVTVDGDYGNKSETAVRSMQAKFNITVDGIAGPQALGYLIVKPAEVIENIEEETNMNEDIVDTIVLKLLDAKVMREGRGKELGDMTTPRAVLGSYDHAIMLIREDIAKLQTAVEAQKGCCKGE